MNTGCQTLQVRDLDYSIYIHLIYFIIYLLFFILLLHIVSYMSRPAGKKYDTVIRHLAHSATSAKVGFPPHVKLNYTHFPQT